MISSGVKFLRYLKKSSSTLVGSVFLKYSISEEKRNEIRNLEGVGNQLTFADSLTTF